MVRHVLMCTGHQTAKPAGSCTGRGLGEASEGGARFGVQGGGVGHTQPKAGGP